MPVRRRREWIIAFVPPLVIVAAVAVLFAVHPLRVESVAWVTGRRDVLHAFFYLLAVLVYLSAAAAPAAREGRRRLGGAVVAFAASLLAKAAGMTLPLVLTVLDAHPLG